METLRIKRPSVVLWMVVPTFSKNNKVQKYDLFTEFNDTPIKIRK
jgi:hypothetical protein